MCVFAGDMSVNSSDEEEEFDMEDAPKVVRKKPAVETEGSATAKQDDAKHSEKAGESAPSAAVPNKNHDGTVSLAPLKPN